MTITDYLRQNNILWTKKKRQQLYFIFNILIPLPVLLPVIISGTAMFLHVSSRILGLEIFRLTPTQWSIVFYGNLIGNIILLLYMYLYNRLTCHKRSLYGVHKKTPAIFSMEGQDITADEFEKKLRPVYIRWYRKERSFRKFVKWIKLYEWDWKKINIIGRVLLDNQ